MLPKNHDEFLRYVAEYVKNNPSVAGVVSDAVVSGVNAALDDVRHRAADMETALAVLANRKYKGRDKLVLSKLKKWQGKSSFDWTWLIERLEDDVDTAEKDS